MNFKTIVWRHRKENLRKCSLRSLETRSDFLFLTYPKDTLPDLSGYILLDMDAPVLSLSETSAKGLFLIDATWAYAAHMRKQLDDTVTQGMVKRSIPENFRTAYPRRQADCPDPERGLASLEALYTAYHLLGWDTTGLLDHYYWKEIFLSKNSFAS